jgi:hypothetical protein
MKRYLLVIIAFASLHFASFAQDVETRQDSVKVSDTLSVTKDFKSFELQENAMEQMLHSSLDTTLHFLPPDPFFYRPGFQLNFSLPSPYYYEEEFLKVAPIRFGFDNGYQGGDLLGVNNQFILTDFLKGNLGFTLSSSYYGPFYPQRYTNGSVSLDLTWKLHDRIRINTYGQYSVREGLNPALSPLINGGNYYGGEVQVKLFKNFGIGLGFVNSYYRKNWTLQPTARPVVFD